MRYDIVKDNKVILTLDTIEEARYMLKMLGYGYEIRPSQEIKKNNSKYMAGR